MSATDLFDRPEPHCRRPHPAPSHTTEGHIEVTAPRLPFRPVERWIRNRYDHLDVSPHLTDPGAISAAVSALVLDTSRRNIVRYRADGLSSVQADRVAVQLGVTPYDLWGPRWAHVALCDALEVEAAASRRRAAQEDERRREARRARRRQHAHHDLEEHAA